MPSSRQLVAATGGLAVALGGLAVLGVAPASAKPDGSALVISEVYGGGGASSSSAAYKRDFVELYNPTDETVDLTTMKLAYRNASGSFNSPTIALTGSVESGDVRTIAISSAGTGGADFPAGVIDQESTSISASATDGTMMLLPTATDAATLPTELAGRTDVIDAVGYGAATTTENAATSGVVGAPVTDNTKSSSRVDSALDADDNSADFVTATPTPGVAQVEQPPAEPVEVSIAEIQGTGATTPLDGDPVITQGVVTAAYPTGGLDGFYLQTPGPGSDDGASDGVFVYSPGLADFPAPGDSVEVAGVAGEFGGQTQVAVTTANEGTVTEVEDLGELELLTTVPGTDCVRGECLTGADLAALREAVESEAFDLGGDHTVTDPYDGSAFFEGKSGGFSNMFGEIGLAAESDVPLRTPTDLARPDSEELADEQAYNAAHRLLLDDGSTWDYATFASELHTDEPFPWMTPEHTVRVGASVSFEEPVVLGFGFGAYRLQPQQQVVGEPSGITIAQDRTEAPAEVGGDLRLATFNVLNYFSTTGEEYVEAGLGLCTYYTDRTGEDPVTTNRCGSPSTSSGNGPRGAADEENLERQQAKIVAAINALDADVVSLEEIENSAKFGQDRDVALETLVAALNEDAGAGTWAAVASPEESDLPPLEEQDVIRTAFIHRTATTETVGDSVVLTDSTAFGNARQPLAQAFKAAGAPDDDAFAVVVNHFKSKSCSGAPDEGDNAEGVQGCWNGDRVRQAEALVDFADERAAELASGQVFVVGDLNSYTQEDPVVTLGEAGYAPVAADDQVEKSYSFDGQVGSLDHVLANEAARASVAGSTIWTINAYESVYYEYSRYNYNTTLLWDASPFRSSDHNPEIVGIEVPEVPEEPLLDARITFATKPSPLRVDRKGKVVVRVTTSDGVVPTGQVKVKLPQRPVRTLTLKQGKVVTGVPAYSRTGKRKIVLTYLGDDRVERERVVATFRVAKKR